MPAVPADRVLRQTVQRGRLTFRDRIRRLRGAEWRILQTALTATAAWVLCVEVLDRRLPVFAAIAAIVCIGVTGGERGRRSFEMVGGVVLGISLADVLVTLLGNGPAQLFLLVVLAMSAAVLLRGGELFMTEAAVSALLVATLDPRKTGLDPGRALEALVGGGVALASNFLIFPPDPLLRASRAGQRVLAELATTLEGVAASLGQGDLDRAERTLFHARELDLHVADLDAVLREGQETARYSLARRRSRSRIELFRQGAAHVDRAVRNARVLARATVRHLRSGGVPSPGLGRASEDLARSVWALAAALDDPDELVEVRRFAVRASDRATEVLEEQGGLSTNVIVGQIQSTAADLLRAAGVESGATADELPTEELLARREPSETAGEAAATRAGRETPSR
jgi:uncharacterized membrane protein YgaE (UPF0421/DUF939 family)